MEYIKIFIAQLLLLDCMLYCLTGNVQIIYSSRSLSQEANSYFIYDPWERLIPGSGCKSTLVALNSILLQLPAPVLIGLSIRYKTSAVLK